jgi:hypothetical protein
MIGNPHELNLHALNPHALNPQWIGQAARICEAAE